ncbi:hypothetical protein FRC12_016920 [Ceratobasidium sp. 428]|nr:hypothetical protein FRC12_016920 [Ceratobasidium sp. 428]
MKDSSIVQMNLPSTPRIIKLLEDEAKKQTERQRRERRYERESQIRELSSQLLEQLAVAIPEGFDDLSLTQRTILLANWLPLPKASAVLEWLVFDGWAGSEVPVEAITERFNTQREDITRLVLDWGKRAKGELVAVLREGREKHGLAIDWSQDALPIVGGEGQGSGDMVDADSSLLLRADSLFTYKGYSRVWSYPEIVQDFCMEYDFDPASFEFHSEASSTAQALLTFLRRPNASSLEFTGERFRCGACYSYKMCLISAVMHYMEMSELWQSVQQSLPNFSTLGIAYNNTHDLSPHTLWPLFLQLSPQEVTDITAKFGRLDKMLSWDEQAVEELEVSLPANISSIVPSGSEDAIGDQGEDVGEGESEGESANEDESDEEPELWERHRFACKLCEQAQLESKLYTFIFIPQMFAHLRNV